MNVIANAGAIRRGVIGAVNLAMRRLAERNFEDVGNEMRFDAVMFAVFFARAGRGQQRVMGSFVLLSNPRIRLRLGIK